MKMKNNLMYPRSVVCSILWMGILFLFMNSCKQQQNEGKQSENIDLIGMWGTDNYRADGVRILSANSKEMDFSGKWYWESTDDEPNNVHYTFTLSLKQSENKISGGHNANLYHQKVDNDNKSISGTVSDGIANIKIMSGYSGAECDAKIEYIDSNKSKIKWTVVGRCDEEHYYPDEAVLSRVSN